MQYVIIGNGIIALSIAFKLSRRVAPADHIYVVGPSARIGSATHAAGAMLNSFAEIDVHALKTDVDLYHFELSHRATHDWVTFEHQLIEAAGNDLPQGCQTCQVHSGGCFNKGTYIINNTASDELDDQNFDAIVNALKEFNESFDFVDPGSIPNYYPSQRDRATRALLIHNEGWLNPRLVMQKIDAIMARSPNITVIEGEVARLIRSGNQIAEIELTDGGKIKGDMFLVANGASAGKLIKDSNIGINIQPLFYGVGVSLEIKSPGFPHVKTIRTPNRGGACGIYTVPYFWGPHEANDHILIGASNFLSPDPFFHGRVVSVSHLLEHARQQINGHFFDAQLVRVNVGWRPTSQDTYPLLGMTSLANLAIATGTKRDGFHLSPVISDYMAALMMGEAVDDRFAVFAPEREVIRELSRDVAIDMGVNSLMSQHYQHGYQPSGLRQNEFLRDAYRRDVEAVHDQVGAKDWGIHPELLNMYRRGFAK